MCEVCAIFGIGDHWTDAAAVSNPAFPAGDIQKFREARRRRLVLVNRLVNPFGLECTDWDGESLALTDRQGRTDVVADLTRLWPCAERLTGVALDPLAPDFLS